MSDLLTTILFGTFVIPDVPSRKVLFDERTTKVATAPVQKRKGIAREAVMNALKRQPSEWLTIGEISAECRISDDTAKKVLNALASEMKASKRFYLTGRRGGKCAMFKWINKNAKKQKAA